MPRRIAFHFFNLAQGGVERLQIALAEELCARGFAVDFVLVQKSGELLPLVPKGVHLIDLNASRTASSIRPLSNYLRADVPDAVFASGGPQNIAAIIARKLARAKCWLGVVQHNALGARSRDQASWQMRMLPLAYRLMLKHADGVFGVSKGVADDIAAVTSFPRNRIGVLYNAGCPANLDPSKLSKVSHPFLDTGDPVLLGVGRLVALKAWDVLLAAFAKVVAVRPARLIIAGIGPMRQELDSRISELGLREVVDLIGYQRDPLAWMAASDLFVLSSRTEGFGIVLVEAMAVGTPVVSTDCEFGPSEILQDGEFGELVPVDDAEAMAAAILRALDTPNRTDRLMARARAFSIDRVADNYLTAAFGSVIQP